jgi:hypothetical protein
MLSLRKLVGLKLLLGYAKALSYTNGLIDYTSYRHRDVDSEDDIEAMALANKVVPETAMSDMRGEAAGEWHVPPDPRSAHAAGRSNIPVSLHPQAAHLLAHAHNLASVRSNQQASRPSTNPTTTVSSPSNQNLLVGYLREFKDEKDKAICKMSKTQLKLFGLISKGASMVPRTPIRPSFSRRSAHFLGIWVSFITTPNAKGFSRLTLDNRSLLKCLAIWGGWKCQFSASLLI